MKKLYFMIFAMLSFVLPHAPACAEDTGWLQPGVRVWYIGGIAGSSDDSSASFSANTQEADLIHSTMGGIVYVVQQQAINSWSIAIPATNWVHAIPGSEGLFWINPQRLNAMQAGQEVQWLGARRKVFAKASYTAETLPFLKLLPLDALFKLSPSREFVVLTNTSPSDDSQYFFDVATGLLCSKPGELGTALAGGDDVADAFASHVLSLAEINYDFAAGRAYAEQDGPHTAFAVTLSASRTEFLSNQKFRLDSKILSRHNDVILAAMQGNFVNVPLDVDYAFENNLAGYITDITANAPNLNLYIDSRSDPQKTVQVAGRDFYRTQMQPAIPSDNSSTTTTAPALPCPAEQALAGDGAALALLREFRDAVLCATPAGRECLRLYYAHADELSSIMQQDPVARLAAAGLIRGLLPMAAALLAGRTAELPADAAARLRLLCAALDAQASPALRAAIRAFTEALARGAVLQAGNSLALPGRTDLQAR